MQKLLSSFKVLLALAAFVTSSNAWSSAQPEFIPETLGDAQKRIRIDHAQELLGRHYSRSQVKYGENVKKINSQIYRCTNTRKLRKQLSMKVSSTGLIRYFYFQLFKAKVDLIQMQRVYMGKSA